MRIDANAGDLRPLDVRPPHNRVRVMFLAGSLSTGGAERFVANAANGLNREGFEPYIALYRRQSSYALRDDVVVKILGKYRPWHNPAACLRLARWIDEVRPDVLVSAWSVPNVFAAEALRWTRHKPVWIARIANNPRVEEAGLYRFWTRLSYRKASGYIAVSHSLRTDFVEVYPFARDKITTIYNAVDINALEDAAGAEIQVPTRNVIDVIAMGRLHRQKRYDVMLRALASARRSADIHLSILGYGEERDLLRRLVQELGLQDHVTWLGFQDNPYPYLLHSDIFILTSDYEGLSNALLEAQGLGLPAVVTDCPFGSAEVVVHGKTGFVAPVGDVEALAAHLTALATDKALRQRMGDAARERIANRFSLDVLLRDLEGLLMRQTGVLKSQPTQCV